MPIFTTTLLLFVTLAALALVTRRRARAKKRRLEVTENSSMKLAAQICEAAARDAFRIELDYSIESLNLLDTAIATNWTDSLNLGTPSDTFTVFAAYVGEIFVRGFGAQWKEVKADSAVPYLFFRDSDLKASPFDLVEQKLTQPTAISLHSAAQSLLDELSRRRESLTAHDGNQ
jgi:hypothetical protein